MRGGEGRQHRRRERQTFIWQIFCQQKCIPVGPAPRYPTPWYPIPRYPTPYPPPDRMTHACEDITFRQLRWWAVKSAWKWKIGSGVGVGASLEMPMSTSSNLEEALCVWANLNAISKLSIFRTLPCVNLQMNFLSYILRIMRQQDFTQ